MDQGTPRPRLRHDLVGSMGQVGAAGDDAAMESLSGLLQNDVLKRPRWPTCQQLRIAIVTGSSGPTTGADGDHDSAG